MHPHQKIEEIEHEQSMNANIEHVANDGANENDNFPIPNYTAQNNPLHDDFDEKVDIANTMAIKPDSSIDESKLHLTANLPDEVRSNLSNPDKIMQEELLLRILAKPGTIYTVDKIVLALWYDHKTKMDRMIIHSRLRNLAYRGYVRKEPRGRGIFSITQEGLKLLGL